MFSYESLMYLKEWVNLLHNPILYLSECICCLNIKAKYDYSQYEPIFISYYCVFTLLMTSTWLRICDVDIYSYRLLVSN